MKPFFAFVFLFLSRTCFSQAAIYLNASDFIHNRPVCESKKAWVKTHELINRKIISLHCKDSTFIYKKSEIYGFKNGVCFYRMFHDKILTLLNPGEDIALYTYTTGSGLKNSARLDYYFISKTPESVPVELSLRNIYQLFEEDKNFVLLLELYFKSDAELIQYDFIHHIYKLNRLYQLSKNLKQ